MESFVWGEHFVTDLEDVDKQHHRLVDVINQFGETLTRPEGIDFDAVERVFGELADYAQYHFAEEESLMRAAGLDPRYIDHHHGEHAQFMQEVGRLHGAISPETPEKAQSLLNFLIYWLAYHILGSDQSVARQIRAIRSGHGSADAYHAEKRKRDGAVEPLLHALDGLFQQVSERNRELLLLNQTLEARVEERTRELAAANDRLREIALTDVLTGLPNRRHAMLRLDEVWKESRETSTPLACMMIDADGFKQVNDTCGHDAGDEVLRQLSRELRYAVRNDDIVCRLGGDEFLVICPRTSLEGAKLLADKLVREVASLRVSVGDGVWRGSVSVGVAGLSDEIRDLESLIKAADRGVYCAKKNGRGQAAVAPAE